MNTGRREFLKSLGLGAGGLGLFSLTGEAARAGIQEQVRRVRYLADAEIARDEDFWFPVQQAFNIDRSLINLNNGGVHPAPRIVMDAVKRYMDWSNGAPVYNSWSVMRPRKELIRKKIAETFGCSPEEIALVRNVTEALQNVLLGLELKPGDEVLTTTHDYPSMKNALYQREQREGVAVKTFSFNYPPKSMDYLLDRFKENITNKTRLILLCHVTNLTGQIFPVRDICRLARERGIEVVIDGAHAFAHFTFERDDLECDFYGANLHKWMMAPIGTGFLYVRKEKIKKIWPLFPAPDPQGDDIRKFEHVGTQPEALKLAVGDAITFHHGIGAKRKEERLRYLRNYWAQQLEKIPGIRILTPYDPAMSCGIGTFTLEHKDIGQLNAHLFDNYKIIVTPVGIPHPTETGTTISAVRVTPSIYTLLRELDMFVHAVREFMTHSPKTSTA
ncbi:MAG: aminotransferase class V-fold PLP-dependent enzyme [Acidobacteria bacterium]|nr:aminotransferase class V-fold PLP-dependent enzyme [Acidobacteriota bacterium]